MPEPILIPNNQQVSVRSLFSDLQGGLGRKVHSSIRTGHGKKYPGIIMQDAI
jgi:hypothetical protein